MAIKPLVFALFFNVLCSTLCAQSTFLSQSDSTGNLYSYLTPSKSVVHGLGVTSLSSYYPDSSFIEAYELAIEDLRANLLTSVYMETFKTTMLNTNFEHAIKDSIDLNTVVKIDSVSKNDRAYFFVTADSMHTEMPSIPENILSRIPNWKKEVFQPVSIDSFWISAGHNNLSRYNLYGSWARSKLNALNSLASYMQTNVQNTTRTYNSFSRQITYITSKVIFKNIIVLKREIDGGRCFTLLAVYENDIQVWE